MGCTLTAEEPRGPIGCHFCKEPAERAVAVRTEASRYQGVGYVGICDACFRQLHGEWERIEPGEVAPASETMGNVIKLRRG
jgi:hypothetical protein